jgi:hypothetical protein
MSRPHIPAITRIWAVLRGHKTTGLVLRELATLSGAAPELVAHHLRRLINGGFVTASSVKPRVYQLVNDIGVDAPRLKRDGTVSTMGKEQANMWRTMRMLSSFDYRQLAAHASTSTVSVPDATARAYIRFLKHGGYLTTITPAKPGPKAARPAVYVLSRNTGPKAPMVQQLSTVFDQNLNEIMWQEEAGNE